MRREFVAGETGFFELERERHKAMLGWLGRLERMGRERWARRVFEAKWETRRGWAVGARRRKTWRKEAVALVKKYSLEEELEELREGVLEETWKEVVRKAVEETAIEEWWENVTQRGSKLDRYVALKKKEWGMEKYVEGPRYGKGEELLAKFRSGGVALGEETRKWWGGGTGVWEEDGSEKTREGLCRVCEEGCVETLDHFLVRCPAYHELREEWWRVVREVGVEGEFDEVGVMLGGELPVLGGEQEVERARMEAKLRMEVASTRLFVRLWDARTDRLYGQRQQPFGVNDATRYGTNT